MNSNRQLASDLLARIAVHHSCERIVELDIRGSSQRPLLTGEERGSEHLGRSRPFELDANALEACVVVSSVEALAAVPAGLVPSAPIWIVTESTMEPADHSTSESQRLRSLDTAVRSRGLKSEFVGWARARHGPDVAVGLIRQDASPVREEPPPQFGVLAIMTAYNEADVIVPAVRALLDQKIEVHLIDNWSTDGTLEIAQREFGERIVTERFPAGGPTEFYQWEDMLVRVTEVADQSAADWFVHHDADERRHGPWEGGDLRESLFRVQQEGYNAVNHTVIEFPPVDDSFPAGSDFETYFTRFSPTHAVANTLQIKAWRGQQVDLSSSGGHEASFADRRVHPYNFLLKHYPIRSQAHGERKVLVERKPRIASGEKGRWHTHYDHVRSGHSFLSDPRDLSIMGEDFAERWLLERLYGFTPPKATRLPPGIRRAFAEALREVGLLSAARSVRRSYRMARRRHPDSGRP